MANNNTFSQEEHDFSTNSKKVFVVGSNATIYAVVNTTNAMVQNSIVTVANFPPTFGGNVTVVQGTSPWVSSIQGNVTISDSKGFIGLTTSVNGTSWPDPKTYIGLVTIDIGTNNSVSLKGNVTLSDAKTNIGLVTLSGGTAWTDPKAYIGLATVNNATAWPDPKTYLGLATIDIGTNNGVAVKGNVTITDSKGFIGLTTSVNGQSWPDPKTFIGLVTVTGSTGLIGTVTIQDGGNSITVDGNVGILGNVTITDSKGFIGLVTVVQSSTARTITGNLTISDSKGFIGLVTLGGGTAWADPKVFIGLVTVGGIGTLTLADPKGFIGLVTAVTKNGGTAKTLIPLPWNMPSTSSIVTVATPTGGNAIFYITNLILNSDATVRLNIKSGVTYLNGNVSLGITLNPGGGWVENGSPDSPTYIGLASGAAIVLEKFDMTATKANIGGKLIYFQE